MKGALVIGCGERVKIRVTLRVASTGAAIQRHTPSHRVTLAFASASLPQAKME